MIRQRPRVQSMIQYATPSGIASLDPFFVAAVYFLHRIRIGLDTIPVELQLKMPNQSIQNDLIVLMIGSPQESVLKMGQHCPVFLHST